MKYKILVLLALTTLPAFPAMACAPPAFPVPDEVRLIQLKQKDGEEIAAADQFLLDSYNKDRDQYFDVYEQLYPCALYADAVASNDMPEEEQEVLKQELVLLERKWNQQGTTEENIKAAEEFVDIPEGEFVSME